MPCMQEVLPEHKSFLLPPLVGGLPAESKTLTPASRLPFPYSLCLTLDHSPAHTLSLRYVGFQTQLQDSALYLESLSPSPERLWRL